MAHVLRMLSQNPHRPQEHPRARPTAHVSHPHIWEYLSAGFVKQCTPDDLRKRSRVTKIEFSITARERKCTRTRADTDKYASKTLCEFMLAW